MKNIILLGDSSTALFDVEPNTVDLVVTSPPYKDVDGYSDSLMRDVFGEIWRVLKPNSLFFLNFGHLAEEKQRPFRVLFMALGPGFQLNETFTWTKNHFSPIRGERRVNNLTEFIFLLYKGKMPRLDRLSIGVPYVDKSNIKRFYSEGHADVRCRGNHWHIPYQTINKKEEKLHNDRFPLQLPEFCIKLSGIPEGSVVLDPFMGSGTTAIASLNLGMSCIGVEKNPQHFQRARERILNHPRNSAFQLHETQQVTQEMKKVSTSIDTFPKPV